MILRNAFRNKIGKQNLNYYYLRRVYFFLGISRRGKWETIIKNKTKQFVIRPSTKLIHRNKQASHTDNN